MKYTKRKNIEIFNLSFLDVISCGFGAIILLLVISKISQPIAVEDAANDLRKELNELKEQFNIKQDQILLTELELQDSEQRLKQIKNNFNINKTALNDTKFELQESSYNLQAKKIIAQKMSQARQELTDEMRRLQKIKPVINKQNTVGGISVNSEYIIFIIDTSGSMTNFAWPLVRKKMKEILEIHPNVKGIQVMNDMGDYMFSQYSGRWIKDTPARRRSILKRLSSWEPFSNSSPEEGITRAIKRFSSTDKQLSLFIFGDDFSRGSIQSLLDTVDRLNHSNSSGTKRVRINAVGFPVLFGHPGSEMNIARFSALMRKLAENNNGSFVGLTDTK